MAIYKSVADTPEFGSIEAIAPQAESIKGIASTFYGAAIRRITNKNMVVRCDTRSQAIHFAATCNFSGWSVQIQKGLQSSCFYALVYFNYPH